jgi:hypothetical protein
MVFSVPEATMAARSGGRRNAVMQADSWDSTIFLGDGADEAIDTAPPGEARPELSEAQRSDLSRRISAAMLFPQGRPGGWLLLLFVTCACVIIEALRLRFV